MPKFMLLIRGGDPDGQISPEEMQAIIQKYVRWSQNLQTSGKLEASEKLCDDGRIVSVKNGKVVDGPFTETKEAVGGYFLVTAADYSEACKIARECPVLEREGVVEVRKLDFQD
jgi:hypothetical protein